MISNRKVYILPKHIHIRIDKMAKINFDTSGTIVTLIIFGILGYFVYDKNIEAAVGVIGIAIIVGIVTMLSLIPIVGWIASILISYFVVIPGMLEITGLENTWLISGIFISNVILGLIITTLMSAAVLKILIVRKRNV